LTSHAYWPIGLSSSYQAAIGQYQAAIGQLSGNIGQLLAYWNTSANLERGE